MIAHLSVRRVAEALDVASHTADDAVLGEGSRVLIDAPGRFGAVRVIGIDEHVWRLTLCGKNLVTVVINLTPLRGGTGPERLTNIVDGHSKAAFKTHRPPQDLA